MNFKVEEVSEEVEVTCGAEDDGSLEGSVEDGSESEYEVGQLQRWNNKQITFLESILNKFSIVKELSPKKQSYQHTP